MHPIVIGGAETLGDALPMLTVIGAPDFTTVGVVACAHIEVTVEFDHKPGGIVVGIAEAISINLGPGADCTSRAAPNFGASGRVEGVSVKHVVEVGYMVHFDVVDIAEALAHHLCPVDAAIGSPDLSAVLICGADIEIIAEDRHAAHLLVLGDTKTGCDNCRPRATVAPDFSPPVLVVDIASVEDIFEDSQGGHACVASVAEAIDVHLFPVRHAGGEFLDAVVPGPAPVELVDRVTGTLPLL